MESALVINLLHFEAIIVAKLLEGVFMKLCQRLYVKIL
jgi:hypothetical protein